MVSGYLTSKWARERPQKTAVERRREERIVRDLDGYMVRALVLVGL